MTIAGVAFAGTEITLGDLAPGEVRAVWLRRTVTAATAALALDGVVLAVTVETLP